MGLFNKRKTNQNQPEQDWDQAPELPELPELPRLPETQPQDYQDYSNENYDEYERPQILPSLPSNSMGEQISKTAIKDAISGGNGGEFEGEANDQEYEMQQPSMRTREMIEYGNEETNYENARQNFSPREMEVPPVFKDAAKRVSETRPVFVRIDKFQEALKVFEQTKNKINEIERMLREIQNIKAQEEQELAEWDADLQALKNKIEKVNQDLFSKIE